MRVAGRRTRYSAPIEMHTEMPIELQTNMQTKRMDGP